MLAPTHLVIGQFAYLCGALATGHVPTVGEGLAAAGAALLPDIDKRDGIVGRLVPWLSGPIEHWVGHRTATHSLLAIALVTLFAWPLPFGWWLASVCGYSSHILADMMTPFGVAFFWPARVRCVIPGNVAYRLEAMGKPELGFAVLCALLSVPVLAVASQGVGPLGTVRDWIGNLSDARRHYDAHKSEADWWVRISGQDNRAFRALDGRYRIVGPYRADGFILETAEGVRSACRDAECDWYAERAVLERGNAEETTTIPLTARHLTKDALLHALEPLQTAGRVYLIGTLEAQRIAERPPTVRVQQGAVQLSYADIAAVELWPATTLRNVDVQVQVRHAPGHVPTVSLLKTSDSGAPIVPTLLRHLP